MYKFDTLDYSVLGGIAAIAVVSILAGFHIVAAIAILVIAVLYLISINTIDHIKEEASGTRG